MYYVGCYIMLSSGSYCIVCVSPRLWFSTYVVRPTFVNFFHIASYISVFLVFVLSHTLENKVYRGKCVVVFVICTWTYGFRRFNFWGRCYPELDICMAQYCNAYVCIISAIMLLSSRPQSGQLRAACMG